MRKGIARSLAILLALTLLAGMLVMNVSAFAESETVKTKEVTLSTTGLCLDILGIKYTHVNENKYTHQWAQVKVNGETWVLDSMAGYCGPKSYYCV